jgi:hypothetical protein
MYEELMGAMQRVLAAQSGGNAHTMSTGLTPADVHVDTMLSNLAASYENEELIADEVFPIVTVPARTGMYWEMDKASNFDVASVDITSSRGRPNEVNNKVGRQNFSVRDFGLMGFVPFDVAAMADRPLNPGRMEVEKIKNMLDLAREVRVASKFTAANFAGGTAALAGGARWDDYTNSDPAAAVEVILDNMLVRPNVMILGAKVARILRSHPKFIAYIANRPSYEGGATPLRPTRKQIAEAFEIDKVLVPKARLNLAADGATLNLGRIWPEDQVAFIKVEKSPNIQKTNATGYTFRYAPAGGMSMEVVSWFDRTVGVRGGSYYKCTHSDTELFIAGVNSGYLLTTVVS